MHPDHRRRGIGRLLLVATFQATGTKRMDLVTDAAAAGFYERFAHKPMVGYRIYPGADPTPLKRLSRAGCRRTGWCGPSRR